MTIKELRQVTKCHIFIERVDADGSVIRREWLGATRDYRIESIKIVHEDMAGFSLAVTLEEEGA